MDVFKEIIEKVFKIYIKKSDFDIVFCYSWV